jgi:hypothetical protein
MGFHLWFFDVYFVYFREREKHMLLKPRKFGENRKIVENWANFKVIKKRIYLIF